MKRPLIAAMALAFAPLPALSQTNPGPVQVREAGAVRYENVPASDPAIREAMRRYQNAREAVFEDWLPDGSMLIVTRFGQTRQLHRVAAPGAARTQITFFDEPIASAQALPGSDRFVYVRDTGGDEWFQAYAAGLNGAETRLTEPGTRNQNNVFTKDGRLMAWAQSRKGTATYEVLTMDPADPSTRKVVHRSEGAIAPTAISPDGRTLLLTRGISNREAELHLLDLATGRKTELNPTNGPVRYEGGEFTADGRGVIVISDQGSDTLQLVEIDVASGRRNILTPDLKWNVEDFDLSPDGRILAYAVNEGGYSTIVTRDFRTRRALPQPTLPKAVLTEGSLKFSPDGSRLGLSLSGPTSSGDAWSVDVATGEATRWTFSELGGLDAAKLIEPELIRFKSFDGEEISAFVYRPRGARGPTPVIMDIHGGPEAQTRPLFNPGVQYFVDTLGATVILPNVRGSDGYGRRFLDLDNAEKREDSVKDIGALLDWIARQPDLDAKRVAVYGQSYGGYMSLAVSTLYPERIVGSVERYGISDFTTFLQNTEAYRRDNRRAEYGDERTRQMQAVFRRISPMNNIAKIRKPMLVMQGANDPRVPKSESDQVVAKLRENGVETWYVVFADEGHGFLKKSNSDVRREVETQFLRRLFEGAPAAPSAR